LNTLPSSKGKPCFTQDHENIRIREKLKEPFYRRAFSDIWVKDQPEGISDEKANDKTHSQSNTSNC
jgi:hypothetical protein